MFVRFVLLVVLLCLVHQFSFTLMPIDVQSVSILQTTKPIGSETFKTQESPKQSVQRTDTSNHQHRRRRLLARNDRQHIQK
jgi:hypothetical protein